MLHTSFEGQIAGDDSEISLSIEKIILFGILYCPSYFSSTHGNQAKALSFYYLVQRKSLVGDIHRDCKYLKAIVMAMFELCQARIELDPDNHTRLYFREPVADFNPT